MVPKQRGPFCPLNLTCLNLALPGILHICFRSTSKMPTKRTILTMEQNRQVQMYIISTPGIKFAQRQAGVRMKLGLWIPTTSAEQNCHASDNALLATGRKGNRKVLFQHSAWVSRTSAPFSRRRAWSILILAPSLSMSGYQGTFPQRPPVQPCQDRKHK